MDKGLPAVQGGAVLLMASLAWPWEPLEPSEAEVDAEEYDTVAERWEREKNRDLDPRMEEWRPDARFRP